jgi:hypothetical protein
MGRSQCSQKPHQHHTVHLYLPRANGQPISEERQRRAKAADSHVNRKGPVRLNGPRSANYGLVV